MNKYQSGSVVGFVVIGGVLLLLFLGGVYFVKNHLGNVGQRTAEVAQQVVEEATPQDEATQEEAAPEQPAEQPASESTTEENSQDQQPASSNQTAPDNNTPNSNSTNTPSTTTTPAPAPAPAPSQVPQTSTAPNNLPTTGPAESFAALIGVMALAVVAVRYRQSLRALVR